MERGQIVTRIACIVLILGAAGAGTRLRASDQSGGRADRTEMRAIEGVWLPFVTLLGRVFPCPLKG